MKINKLSVLVVVFKKESSKNIQVLNFMILIKIILLEMQLTCNKVKNKPQNQTILKELYHLKDTREINSVTINWALFQATSKLQKSSWNVHHN